MITHSDCAEGKTCDTSSSKDPREAADMAQKPKVWNQGQSSRTRHKKSRKSKKGSKKLVEQSAHSSHVRIEGMEQVVSAAQVVQMEGKLDTAEQSPAPSHAQ